MEKQLNEVFTKFGKELKRISTKKLARFLENVPSSSNSH